MWCFITILELTDKRENLSNNNLISGGGGEAGGCKLTGEVTGVPGVVSHPATIVITMFLACVHSVTGLDLLTAFSLLITIVTFVSLIIH